MSERPESGEEGMLRVLAIKRSLRCFVFAWLGLLPWVGIPFLGLALWQSGAGRKLERRIWNPARGYRLVAFGLTILGGLLNLGAFGLAALAYIQSGY